MTTLSGSADATGYSIASGTDSNLTLGNTSGAISGKIFEVMLYDNKLQDYSRKRLEGYLAHKWGGTANLPTGHPFKTTAPDFGGSQSIVTNVHTITGTPPTLSRDIGLFTLEEYNIYATSGLPLSYASDNTSVIAVNNGKLEPKASGTANITLSQAGDTYFTAASNQIFSLKIDGNQSQEITFNTIVDTNTSVSNFSLSASASSGMAVTFSSSDTSVVTISGSTANIVGPGTVTITATQAGGTDSNGVPWATVSKEQTITVTSTGKALTLVFDDIGNMGTSQTFKVRAVLFDGTSGKPVDMTKYTSTGGNLTYSITSRTDGGSPASGNLTPSGGFASITTGSSNGNIIIKAMASGGGYATQQTSVTVAVDSTARGQTILVREGGDAGGLR